MATMDTTGLDELIRDMRRMGEYSGEQANKMVLAAGEVIKDSWIQEAQKRRLRKSGQMIGSIGYAKDVKDIGGVKYTDVYPQGKDSKTGVRNAQKAFILHFGSSRWKDSRGRGFGWVDEASAKAEQPVERKLTEMWGQFLENGKVST